MNGDNTTCSLPDKESDLSVSLLEFLPDTEKQKVINTSRQIHILGENEKLHKRINSHKIILKEWDRRTSEQTTQNNRNKIPPPFLAASISNEMRPRVFRILSTIYNAAENLGGSINSDYSLQIRGEQVRIEIAEGQDKVKHELTKSEAAAMIKYEDDKRHYRFASEPQIRKYDNVYNNRLRISIRQYRYYRDTDKSKVEARLGDMLIDLYEESEIVRNARMAREEEQRKREEEARQKEERRIRYNIEVERTNALENLAKDYDMACKIRAYVAVVEAKINVDEQTREWIDWANKKADWYDPTIARNDEFFGKREHNKDDNSKELKKIYSSWY